MKKLALVLALLSASSAFANGENPAVTATRNALKAKLGLTLRGALYLNVYVVDQAYCSNGGRSIVAELQMVEDTSKGLDSHGHPFVAATTVLRKYVVAEKMAMQLNSPDLIAQIHKMSDCLPNGGAGDIRFQPN